MLIKVNKDHPQPYAIERAVQALRDGKVIALPTDTTYGIGASLFEKKAIEHIYLLKNHKRNKPLSILCEDLKMVSLFAHIDDAAYRVMRECLPGPYTFVMHAKRVVPKLMMTRRKTVGIRVPNHAVTLAIIHALGDPIISTTAMSQDREVLDTPEEILRVLGHGLEFVLDAGPIRNEPSTVVDLTGPEPVLIRRGKGPIAPLGIPEPPPE